MHDNLTPSAVPLARTYDTTISSATTINLQASTHFIRVVAIDQGVFLRYQAGVTSSNFDEYIHADTVQDFIVPEGVTAISVIERQATGAVVVIEK
jgi:hypothetical protein